MRIRASVFGALLTLLAAPALSQTAAGRWNASVDTPNGPFAFVFEFVVDAAGKLTGAMHNELFGAAPISEGVVNGKDISFKLSFAGDFPMTINYKGTVEGNELKMTSTFVGEVPGGGPAEMSFTATRSQ
jgi:hypothetical protein